MTNFQPLSYKSYLPSLGFSLINGGGGGYVIWISSSSGFCCWGLLNALDSFRVRLIFFLFLLLLEQQLKSGNMISSDSSRILLDGIVWLLNWLDNSNIPHLLCGGGGGELEQRKNDRVIFSTKGSDKGVIQHEENNSSSWLPVLLDVVLIDWQSITT